MLISWKSSIDFAQRDKFSILLLIMCFLRPTKRKANFLPLLAMAFLLCQMASAESFRTQKTSLVILNDINSRQTIKTTANQCVAIQLPENREFIQGIEIKVSVPKIVAQWTDSVAWSLYTGLREFPSEKKVDYNANRATVGTFGSSLSLNIRIPVISSHKIRKDAYSHLVDVDALNNSSFILLRLQKAMKGAPQEISTSEFELTISCIAENKGRLKLKLTYPETKKEGTFTLFIDEKQTDFNDKGFILSAGSHDINLVSDFFRNELRTIIVEKGTETTLEINLRDIKPLVRLTAPAGTKLTFDGKEYTAPIDPFYSSEGEHTIKFTLGDYEQIQKINFLNGRTYNLSVSLEASVSESEE